MAAIRSFRQRMADEDTRETLEGLSLTERLLVQILIELMHTRGRCGQTAIARRLRVVGFSTKQIAALLHTTPASLAVAKRRAEGDSDRVD